MINISTTHRALLLGIDNLSTMPIIAYTIAFGVLLVAALLLILLGFYALDSTTGVIGATLIPLCDWVQIWINALPLLGSGGRGQFKLQCKNNGSGC